MSTVEIKDLAKESNLTAKEMQDIRGGNGRSVDQNIWRELTASIDVGETLKTGTLVINYPSADPRD